MMTRGGEERTTLAGAYVLGVLDESEREQAEAMIAGDRVFALQVREWQERLAPLDATADAIPPSPALWQRIEATLGSGETVWERPRQPVQIASGASGWWEWLEFWRWSALGAAAVALLLFAMSATMVMRWPSQPVMVAVLEADNGRPGAIVQAYASGDVRLIPLEDIAVPQGRALQVWTLRNRQEGPISVGLLDKARSVRLDLGKLPAPGADQLFEITLEPESGSPTGRPTGPILMKGLTASTL